MYRQFGGVRKVIEQAQQQLAQVRMFSMMTMQTQEAIAMLRALQGLGVSLDEIYSLTKLLDLPKMAAAALQQRQNDGQQLVKCSKCGNEAEGTAEPGEHLKAQKHLPAHSQPEHTEYTAYQDQRMTEIEKRLEKLENEQKAGKA